MIDCQAEGDPTPTVSWKRQWINTSASDGSERITQLQNNSLQIIVAQLVDTDLYMCVANNSIRVVLKKVQVLVQGEFQGLTASKASSSLP